MNPKEIQEVFFNAYRNARLGREGGVERITQSEIYDESWQAVIDYITTKIDKEWADKYLALSNKK